MDGSLIRIRYNFGRISFYVCIDGNSVSVGGDSTGMCAVYAGGKDFGPAPSVPVEEAPGMFIYSDQNQSNFIFPFNFMSLIQISVIMSLIQIYVINYHISIILKWNVESVCFVSFSMINANYINISRYDTQTVL